MPVCIYLTYLCLCIVGRGGGAAGRGGCVSSQCVGRGGEGRGQQEQAVVLPMWANIMTAVDLVERTVQSGARYNACPPVVSAAANIDACY